MAVQYYLPHVWYDYYYNQDAAAADDDDDTYERFEQRVSQRSLSYHLSPGCLLLLPLPLVRMRKHQDRHHKQPAAVVIERKSNNDVGLYRTTTTTIITTCSLFCCSF